AGDPWIEVNEHLLQSKEIPRGLRWIHREVGICGFFERSIQRDGPDHQNNRDDDGGEKFDAQQKRPDVNFLLPAGFERPGLAMMGLGERGVALQLCDQQIVGVRLLPRQINVEAQQGDQAYDWNVVWSRANFPKLSPVHNYSRVT